VSRSKTKRAEWKWLVEGIDFAILHFETASFACVLWYSESMNLRSLTPDEERVILHKGTEAPFSGKYEQFDELGMYACRQCGAFLYRSDAKFDARCGWPSFDQEVLGAVLRVPDSDGRRTEIVCRRCEAHLGHVFTGEGFTEKNSRHCVNSVSLEFVAEVEALTGQEQLQPDVETAQNVELGVVQSEKACLGGGCFWCAEAVFQQVRGVRAVTSGYAGGATADPTYEAVCSGTTGHAEVVRVEFVSTEISFEGVLDVFFATHDPTTKNRQGADVGSQYRSVILAESDEQLEQAREYVQRLEEQQVFAQPVVTELERLETFYLAEEYHQNYFANHPEAGYCQAVIAPKVKKLQHGLGEFLRE
jgi:peptide methionine sulfoxide reductase msrA/msrB